MPESLYSVVGNEPKMNQRRAGSCCIFYNVNYISRQTRHYGIRNLAVKVSGNYIRGRYAERYGFVLAMRLRRGPPCLP